MFLKVFFNDYYDVKGLHVKLKGHVQTPQGNNRKNNSNQSPRYPDPRDQRGFS
jgi:hypothetical protein